MRERSVRYRRSRPRVPLGIQLQAVAETPASWLSVSWPSRSATHMLDESSQWSSWKKKPEPDAIEGEVGAPRR